MKKFDIPAHYKSSIISHIKELRKKDDPRKKDFTPTRLDFGPVVFLIARHFGFCYGVENAIEIAYRTIEENPGKKVFLLSEMIHNSHVNEDLRGKGIEFIMDNYGKQFVEWSEITSEDIVIIPAFGTTIEIEKLLKEKGIDTVKYNTTCPFVEKVWNRAEAIGKDNYTIIIHGKHKHEETRATFSRSIQNSPSLIIRDIEETKLLSKFILGVLPREEFYKIFNGKYSPEFDIAKDLVKVGVVNQTTILASETLAIADLIRDTMIKKYGLESIKEHFADTRDTLCYATNDNQSATIGLMQHNADLAIVVGGYNSSNTSHLVELLTEKFPTYFISEADKIVSSRTINHFDLHVHTEKVTNNYLPEKKPVTIALTSGASCPDSLVDEVIKKLIGFFDATASPEDVIREIEHGLL
ncbi:MAG: 4-hydroxy-3-methylbut-2-enyl diphosphate reductase [Bacteroidota bacterium]